MNSPFSRSLGRRMAALILLGAGCVLTLVLGYSYLTQRARVLTTAAREGDALAQSVVFQIEASLGRAEALVQQVALLLEPERQGRSESIELIQRTLEAHPAMFGMAVALSDATESQADFRMLYGFRHDGTISVGDRKSPFEDYQHDWFYLPYLLQQPMWIEPYFDSDAQALMVTYSVPVLRAEEVVAVVTCDLSLDEIRDLLSALPLGDGGQAVLLSQRGTFIAHPNSEWVMRETIFSIAESQSDPLTAQSMKQLGDGMLSGVAGHQRYRQPFSDEMAYMYYRCVPSTGWAFGVVRPEAQVLAPLMRLNQISALVALLGLLLLLVPAMGIAWSVSRPLGRLADAAQRIAVGNFDVALPAVHTRDEVARLTGAFEQMRCDLRRYIDDLTASTAAKERVAGELSAAREIQMSIVPKLFPPFPCRPEIDLHAMLLPALEVGGDLYDFALLDEDHLYVAIGDVSGKGVPASLLMAVGKTLLKSTVQNVRDPARALAHVNAELEKGNDSCMFITMFCGILNLNSGDFLYANAGHNPPLVVHGDRTVGQLNDPPDVIVGVSSDANYQVHSRRLDPGDLLLLFTDGVTEAMNSSGEQFGDSRLRELVQQEGHRGAQQVLECLGRAVRAHAAQAAQSDDITALAVRYQGAADGGNDTRQPPCADQEADASLTLRNQLDELPRLRDWIGETGSRWELSETLRSRLNLLLEEWLVNVISYAYGDAEEHLIELRMWRVGDELRVEVSDDGRPFDPTAQARADTSLPLEHRPIGGLGIHLMRQTTDQFLYRRQQERNVITLVLALAQDRGR